PTGASPAAWSSRHRSPVPQARSSTTAPAGRSRAAPVRRRHPTSMRKVMTRLTTSYRGAMASNIARTARTFSAPSGSVLGAAFRAMHDDARDSDQKERVGGDYAPGVQRAHFRILGVPVRVEPFFLIVAVAL